MARGTGLKTKGKKPRTKKQRFGARKDLISLTFICLILEMETNLPFSEIEIETWEHGCEMCGSHGETVFVIKKCPLCEKQHRIEYEGH